MCLIIFFVDNYLNREKAATRKRKVTTLSKEEDGKWLENKTKKVRKAHVRVVQPAEMKGFPAAVFGSTFLAVRKSDQWTTSNVERREQLLTKSWNKILKLNPEWFLDGYELTPLTTSKATSTDFIANITQKPVDDVVVDVDTKFCLAKSDVRVEVNVDHVCFIKQKQDSIYQKSVIIATPALVTLCDLVDEVLAEYRKCEYQLTGALNIESNFKAVVDPVRSVFVSVSVYEGHTLLHIRRYLIREIQGTTKFIPTKDGVTITAGALIDLKNRVLKLIIN